MSKAQTQINKLKRDIARAEATLQGMRDQLAALERGETLADRSQDDAVLALWKECLPKGRERSSKQMSRVAWNRIPKASRPDLEFVVAALRTWNRSEEWLKEKGAFVPGLHRWIAGRRWEDLPKVADPISKYRKTPKPEQAHQVAEAAPGEIATGDDIRSIFGGFKARCTPPAPAVQPTGNPGEICQISAETATVGPDSARYTRPAGDLTTP